MRRQRFRLIRVFVLAYVCGVGTKDGGWGFGLAEDSSDRAACRVQDVHCRPAVSRPALSRGRGLKAAVSCALATSIYTWIPRTRCCWDVQRDRRHRLFSIYLPGTFYYVSFISFIPLF